MQFTPGWAALAWRGRVEKRWQGAVQDQELVGVGEFFGVRFKNKRRSALRR